MRVALVLAAGAMALHLAVVCFLLPPPFVLDERPILFADYTVHLRSCLLHLRLRESGAAWGYDPFQMAGYPAGIAESASNHAAEAFVGAFGAARPVAAFKVWLFLSFLGFPLLVAAATAVMGCPARAVAAAVWVASLTWCLDPTFRLFREFGGSGFPLASAICLLATALAFRFLRRGGWSAALGVVCAAMSAVWVHALSIPILGITALATVAATWSDSTGRRRAALPALLAIGFAPALVWLVPLVENWRWLTSTAYRLGTVGAADLLALVLFAPGMRVEGGLLWLGAAGCAVLWRRQPAIGRWLAPPAALWLLLACAPLSSLRGLQPRRFMLTTLIWLVPAVVAAADLLLQAVRPRLRVLVLSAVVATGAAFQLLPWLQVLAGTPARMASLVDRARVPDDVAHLVAWAAARPAGGRVLLEDMDHIANEAYGGTFIGGLLPFWSGTAVLGGPSEQPFQQQTVDLCYGRWLGTTFTSLSGEHLSSLLDRYAVHWIVAVNPDTTRYLSGQTAAVASAERWGRFATFAVRSPAAMASGARSVDLDINRVAVHGATAPATTIAVHWHQRVRTIPSLAVERIVYPDDQVGLIRVRNGEVRDFAVVFD